MSFTTAGSPVGPGPSRQTPNRRSKLCRPGRLAVGLEEDQRRSHDQPASRRGINQSDGTAFKWGKSMMSEPLPDAFVAPREPAASAAVFVEQLLLALHGGDSDLPVEMARVLSAGTLASCFVILQS